MFYHMRYNLIEVKERRSRDRRKEYKMTYKIIFRAFESSEDNVIDIINGPIGYTAQDYIRDCKEQMSPEWNDMLDHGTVRVCATL